VTKGIMMCSYVPADDSVCCEKNKTTPHDTIQEKNFTKQRLKTIYPKREIELKENCPYLNMVHNGRLRKLIYQGVRTRE